MPPKKNSSHSQNFQSRSKFKTFDDFEPDDEHYLESTIHEMYHSERIEQLSSDDYL